MQANIDAVEAKIRTLPLPPGVFREVPALTRGTPTISMAVYCTDLNGPVPSALDRYLLDLRKTVAAMGWTLQADTRALRLIPVREGTAYRVLCVAEPLAEEVEGLA